MWAFWLFIASVIGLVACFIGLIIFKIVQKIRKNKKHKRSK